MIDNIKPGSYIFFPRSKSLDMISVRTGTYLSVSFFLTG